jgi:hypothetical protein
MQRLRTLTALFCLLLLTACADPAEQVIGRWQFDNGQISEFMNDGTVATVVRGSTYLGTWRLEGDNLTLVTPGDEDTVFRLLEVTEESIRVETVPRGRVLTGVRLTAQD